MPGRCTGLRRFALYARNDFTCSYCGLRIALAGCYGLTLDHVIPTNLGLDDSNGNLIVACRRCNSVRQHTPIEEFVQSMAKERGYDADAIMQGVRAQLARIPDVAGGMLARVERQAARGQRAVLEAAADALIEAHRKKEEQRTGRKTIDTCMRERRANPQKTRLGVKYNVRSPEERPGMSREQIRALRKAHRARLRVAATEAELFQGKKGGTFFVTPLGKVRHLRKPHG